MDVKLEAKTGGRHLESTMESPKHLSETWLGRQITFPGTALTVQRMCYGAMQPDTLAELDGCAASAATAEHGK